jgi:hypothetical protein
VKKNQLTLDALTRAFTYIPKSIQRINLAIWMLSVATISGSLSIESIN